MLDAGNVREEIRESAAVALAFVRLHADWISEHCFDGQDFEHDPDQANVKIHLSPVCERKTGTSMGAALVGESQSEYACCCPGGGSDTSAHGPC